MKRAFLAFALAVASLAGPFPAFAANSYPLAVGAVVLSKNSCRFNAGSGTAITFPSINPSSGSNVTASVVLNFTCIGASSSVSYTITSNDGLYSTGAGLPRMRHATTITQFLPYTLNTPVSGTTTKNTATDVTVTGTITPAGFANAVGGSYADTLVLTLAP